MIYMPAGLTRIAFGIVLIMLHDHGVIAMMAEGVLAKRHNGRQRTVSGEPQKHPNHD